IKKWSIVPQRLVKAEHPELEVKVLGQKLSYPVAVAPIGAQTIFHADGEIGSALAARSENVPFIMSTASSISIGAVAEANGNGTRWYQLYWPSNENNEIIKSILQRAQRAGFSALIVTLDTYLPGWRSLDMDNGYNPFLRSDSIGVQIGLTDAADRNKFKEKHGLDVEHDPDSQINLSLAPDAFGSGCIDQRREYRLDAL
ncbi:FMN-linked oxidoreductase, partial [Pseudovirgaria hyperparasitica]